MENRRSFLVHLTGLAAAGGVAGVSRSVEAGAAPTVVAQAALPKWDTTWLDSFKGRHKQVYDLLWHTLRPTTLNPPLNYLEAHKEVSGLAFPDVNVVVGANSTCLPIMASDALWSKFKLGERYNIKDPATGQPATRNVYLEPAAGGSGSSVKTLQAKGALFIMCNNALLSTAADWSRELGTTAPQLHAELTAGLHAGVKVVPALTWAVGMLQERGFTYEKL